MKTPEEKLDLANRAIVHVLRRIRSEETVRYHLGFGTQSFALLTEAAAAIAEEPVEQVREFFAGPPTSKKP